jgi:acetylglutamate kinase
MTDSIQILSDAFKELKKYHESTFLIQVTGAVLEDQELIKSLAEDIVALQNSQINIIIVHDGSNIVSSLAKKFSSKDESDSIRITDQSSAEIVEMILSGHVNQKLVSQINIAGGYACGISGKDAQFMIARRAKLARYDYGKDEKILNFGFQGELSLINPDILFQLEDNGAIPVVSPIALGDDGKTYKINASDISGAISSVLGVKKMIFISDYPGITDTAGEVICELNDRELGEIALNFKDDTDLSGYINSALMAMDHNVESVHILNGQIPHCLIRELFTDELVGSTIKTNN